MLTNIKKKAPIIPKVAPIIPNAPAWADRVLIGTSSTRYGQPTPSLAELKKPWRKIDKTIMLNDLVNCIIVKSTTLIANEYENISLRPIRSES